MTKLKLTKFEGLVPVTRASKDSENLAPRCLTPIILFNILDMPIREAVLP